ncbi:MAG TPA: hypothetical protein VGG59_07620 [Acidobacteriaceae bacterium]
MQKQFVAELQALEESGTNVGFDLQPHSAWYLLSALQLTLQHPRFQQQDAFSDWLREFATNLELFVCRGGPAMTKIAAMGWNREDDIREFGVENDL